ncbi:unnamed protein product [Caenorhabditis brenneri]
MNQMNRRKNYQKMMLFTVEPLGDWRGENERSIGMEGDGLGRRRHRLAREGEQRKHRLDHGWLGMENNDNDWIMGGSGWRTTTTTIGLWMARDGLDGERRRQRLDHRWLGMEGEQRRQRLDYGWLGMDWMENDDDNDWIIDGSGWKENNDDNDWIMDGSGWIGWRTTTTTTGLGMARDGLDGERRRQRLDHGWLGMEG